MAGKYVGDFTGDQETSVNGANLNLKLRKKVYGEVVRGISTESDVRDSEIHTFSMSNNVIHTVAIAANNGSDGDSGYSRPSLHNRCDPVATGSRTAVDS